MDTKKCKMLLKEKKFSGLINTLKNELITLYKEMLSYANVEYADDASFRILGSNIIKNYPKYKDQVITNENALCSGEYDFGEAIETLLDSYNYMSKKYKKDYKG